MKQKRKVYQVKVVYYIYISEIVQEGGIKKTKILHPLSFQQKKKKKNK